MESPVHQTSKHIDQENMNRIKCIEKVLQISNIPASLMVIEIKKQKAREGIVLCTEETQLDKARYNV